MALGLMTSMAQSSGIEEGNLDRSVRAQDDFYQFACGGWMANNPLPAAYSRFGSFDQLALNNDKRINGILDELQAGTWAAGSLEQKISDLYKLAMDSVRRNREGVAPVMPYIAELEGAKSKCELLAIMEKYAAFGFGLPYGYGFEADEKDAGNNILNVRQGSTTLGQKEYYLENDEATIRIRTEYKKYVVRMLQLFGFDEATAEQKMEYIFRLETTYSIAQKSRTELRDVEKNYHKMSLEEFESRYPNLRLTIQANAEGIATEYMQTLVVGQPEYLDAADKIFGLLTADELRAMIEWRLIQSSVSYLSDEVAEVQFDFRGRVMSGRKQDYERWQKATSLVDNILGEQLGKIYCERYFPESSKQRMRALIANLQAALSERIEAQSWMSNETKAASQEKLSTFYVKVGYPDKWEDVSGLIIDPTKSLYENVMSARKFKNTKDIEETAGKPVDRDKWYMTPQTVNAYYNPTTNEICFPAGILQVPFFDPEADDAFNYGAIGVVIGHEMTHGFDDQGSHYDKDGNMSDWWQPSDVENFKARTGAYADYFSNIKVLPDLNANGPMTLGENLADHGGLEVAFCAYKRAADEKTRNIKDVLGFTGAQRFFIAYAGVWGQNITEEEIRNRTRNDVHALGMWRVNGALPHINAFYEAFDVKPGDGMYINEEQRLKLW